MNRKTQGTFVLQANLPQEVILRSGARQEREEFLGRLNDYCDSALKPGEFMGLTEGVLLAEEAHERGYETESWVLDAGMAPHERDWVAQEKVIKISVYFASSEAAEAVKSWILQEVHLEAHLEIEPRIEFQPDQDWNAQWKASFQGIEVDEGLRVLPPWHEEAVQPKSGIVIINPGAGFGTGTHETTQLCLKVLRQVAKRYGGTLQGKTVLDFGSGSGILGISAALMGAKVFGVEVDPMANENAVENAKLNGLNHEISFQEKIPEMLTGAVDILLANILRPILLQFAPQIIACLKPQSELILSGLIESDLEPVLQRYAQGDFYSFEKLEKGEWRAISFVRKA